MDLAANSASIGAPQARSPHPSTPAYPFPSRTASQNSSRLIRPPAAVFAENIAAATRNSLSSRIASKALKTNDPVCLYPERPGAPKSSPSVRLRVPFFAGISAELGRNGHSTVHPSKSLKKKARACARAKLPGAFSFSLFPLVARP
jgi:hypothetical protein